MPCHINQVLKASIPAIRPVCIGAMMTGGHVSFSDPDVYLSPWDNKFFLKEAVCLS